MEQRNENNSIQHKNNSNEQKKDTTKQVAGFSFIPVSSDILPDENKVTKLPLDLIPSLGVGFASLPESVRTITQTVATPEGVFQLLHANGTPFAYCELQSFSNEAAKMGSQYLGASGWEQARVFEVASMNQITTVPFDPTTLAVAIALAQINQKLDGIQDTLDELINYLRIKDKAQLRESLETLSSILNDYKYNWNNKKFKDAKYLLAQDINRSSRQSIIELRAHLLKELDKKGFAEFRDHTGKSSDKIFDALKDYQLAIYLYSFSTFLCIVLLENYDEAYLNDKAKSIRQKALEYRELYTKCFDAIEKRSEESIDNTVGEGLSFAFKGLGKVLAATPLGKENPVSNTLIGVSKGIGSLNQEENRKMTERFISAKDPSVLPFAESIESINNVYNKPSRLFIDNEAIYFLPDDSYQTKQD